jgi:hypothetical protein
VSWRAGKLPSAGDDIRTTLAYHVPSNLGLGKREKEELDPRAKNAIRGAFLGFFVDMFDIYLPIVVLAPAIAYFVSPELGTTATAIVSGSIFAATLVGRPIGHSSSATSRMR